MGHEVVDTGWVEVHAFGPEGWDEQRYMGLPDVERRAIDERHEVRRLAREALSDVERFEAKKRRRKLETSLTGDPEVLALVAGACRKMFLVASAYLTDGPLSLEELRVTLRYAGYLDDALTRTFLEQLQAELIKTALFNINLALEEAWMNHYKHGVQADPRGRIGGRARVVDGVYETESWDSGEGFNREEVADPTADENLESVGGRGLLLMRHYMDAMEILDDGRRFRMVKDLRRKQWTSLIVKEAADLVKVLAAERQS